MIILLLFIVIPSAIIIAYALNRIINNTESTSSKNVSTPKGLTYTPLSKTDLAANYNVSNNNFLQTPQLKTVKQENLSSEKSTSKLQGQPSFDTATNNSNAHHFSNAKTSTYMIDMSYPNLQKLCERYIAFDVETTGLSPYSERIIEVGAVIFENGQKVNEFNTLINPGIPVPSSATKINHITNAMLADAPTESEAYPKLVNFLGNALSKETIICAHNARFDMSFLSNTFSRLGYDAEIVYVDTLSIARNLIPGLDNYKQPTIANHFGIVNNNEHRAASDAEVCGIILSKLLDMKLEEHKIIFQEKEKRELEERLKQEAFIKLQNEFHEKRNGISINPNNERVPLNEIRNLNDTNQGYIDGYHFFCTGETYRKSSNLEDAVKEYDKARFNGYCHQALYKSYAMIFHQNKDYDNEIDILDEGIQRFQNDISICEKLEIRRNKAVIAFIERQEKENVKAAQKLERIKKQQQHISKVSQGRAVLQLSDEMVLIKRYETIAEAARETGTNTKGIRDAAKGVQKHCGGFVWRYAEEFDFNHKEN